jgi:D,D-heptose 1,7-bisphosphate phosphatase
MNKAVFLDKDGTLIKDVNYNVNPGLIEFEPYAFEALELLQRNGFLTVVVTNQPGIALGYFTEEELQQVHLHIKNTLQQQKISLHGFYYCPHHLSRKLSAYSIACNCRKPASGLLLKAAEDLQISLSRSWMIGDILNDIEAGKRAGCKTILINNGNETEWVMNEIRKPDFVADDLLQAAKIILERKV